MVQIDQDGQGRTVVYGTQLVLSQVLIFDSESPSWLPSPPTCPSGGVHCIRTGIGWITRRRNHRRLATLATMSFEPPSRFGELAWLGYTSNPLTLLIASLSRAAKRGPRGPATRRCCSNLMESLADRLEILVQDLRDLVGFSCQPPDLFVLSRLSSSGNKFPTHFFQLRTYKGEDR